MPRGIDLLIAQIAITRAGAAWVPFDAEAPVERIAVCLTDAQANGLVTCAAWTGRAAATGRSVWTPEALSQADDGHPMPARAAGLTREHPAYLIYTSGSTGTPKAIVISHRNICHFLRSGNALYGIGPDDVARAFQPFEHVGDEGVARAVTAAATAVREHHRAQGLRYRSPVTWQAERPHLHCLRIQNRAHSETSHTTPITVRCCDAARGAD
jgi:non-ribosomal peptide synthetase component F